MEDSQILEVCGALESNDAALLLPYEGLLKSYWGAYLGTADIMWANEKREYYDRCYINACAILGEKHLADGQYEEALNLLKNAYRLDMYSELLVGEIIRCYASLGQPNQARRCYEEYSARLDEEFGTRPGKWLRNSFFSCFAEEM